MILEDFHQDIDSTPFQEVEWRGKRVMLATSQAQLANDMMRFLGAEGLVIQHITSAEQGMEVFHPENFELLIIDVDLNGDGLMMGHRLKFKMKEHFVPLLFITSHSDEISLASCFEAGGDDLVTIPYSDTMLFSRINSLLKMGGSYHQQYRERKELAYYHNVMQSEQKLAKSIFNSIVHQDYLDRENIRYTLSPMSIFNGDMLLSAMTPNGHEYILLGDFTGHGLTASIGTLPVSEIFYSMTAKGFTLTSIISEINRRLKKLLPLEMFMATYAIDVNRYDKVISVWGGGIPDLLLKRFRDNQMESISAKNLPLGIIDSQDLELTMQVIPVDEGDRFYIYTDGVVETENHDGKLFGTQALRDVISSAGRDDNIYQAIMDNLEQFRDGYEQSDDITLLEYAFVSTDLQNYFDNDKTLPVRSLKSQWRMHLHLDADAIKAYDPRPLLSQMMSDLQGVHSFRGQIHTILSELYKNAIEYGVLKMDPSLRKQNNGILKYNQIKKDRLEALGEGFIHIEMGNQISSETSGKLFIVIEDSGKGFDYNKLKDDIFADKHRGLGLVNQFADKVQFEAPGNKVRIECYWTQ
jgi:two-component system, HptB-dependent secretion and biofilm response regulator